MYKKLNLSYVEYDYHEFLADFKFDKKNIAKTINLILIDQIGHSLIYPVKESEL